jgi:hypothetical protein
VGTPVELAIPARKRSKLRPGVAGLLAAASLGAGMYFLSSGQQPAAPATPIAPAPLTATRVASGPGRVLAAPPAAKTGDLDPPIGTTYDPNTAAEDDALLSGPAREARKAARVKLAPLVRKEPSGEVQGATPPAKAPLPGAAPQTPPSEASAETPPRAAATENEPVAPSELAPPAEPKGSAASAAPTPPAPKPPAPTPPTLSGAPASPEPPSAEPAPPTPPRMDRENPY